MKRVLSVLLILILTVMVLLPGLTAGAAELCNEQIVYNYLTKTVKLNTAAACGLMANIQKESLYNPHALGDSGTSYGICQWHNSNWDSLKNYCNKNGYDWQTLDGQLHFLENIIRTGKKDGITYLAYLQGLPNTAQGAYEAGYFWCYNYERPASRETSSVTRGELARDTYWPKYTNPTPDAPIGYYLVDADGGLRIRNGPDTYYSRLGAIPNHSQMAVTATVGNFGKITYVDDSGESITGWVTLEYAEFLKPFGEFKTKINSVTGGNGSIDLSGWALDKTELDRALEIHLYIGGTADVCTSCYVLMANTSCPEVETLYPGAGEQHGFDYSVRVEETGKNKVYLYALNPVGEQFELIYSGEVDIAEYVPPVITLSFDANGGENPPTAQSDLERLETVIPTVIPTRARYVFMGWATDKSATDAEYQPGDPYSAEADAVLYAVWRIAYGDLSGDGTVDATDLVALQQALLTADMTDQRMDTNGDGVTDVRDLVRLERHLADRTVPLGS